MEIKCQKLTKKKFSAFGDIISIDEDIQYKIINKGYTKKYELSKYMTNEKEYFDDITISIFRGLKRPIPLTINMLECHPLASQSFMPLNNGKWIIIVCESNNGKPALKKIKCFVANENQGINFFPGTWHHPLITLEETQDFMVVDRKDTTDKNLKEFHFENLTVKT